MASCIPNGYIIKEKTDKGNAVCFLCGVEIEDSIHIFKQCHFIRALAFASKWGCRLDNWDVNDIKHWIWFYVEPVRRAIPEPLDTLAVTLFLASLLYIVWHYRNEELFKGKIQLSQAMLYLERTVEEFSHS